MGKKSRSSKNASKQTSERWEDPEVDEVDAFSHGQDEILLEQAGIGKKSDRPQQGNEHEMSDEEVMGISEDDEDVDVAGDEMGEDGYGDEENDDPEDVKGWGQSRANYYGADEIADEEQAKLEEEEARRLQKKHLSAMSEADYYDDDELEDWKQSVKANEDEAAFEDLPQQDPSQMDDSERVNMMNMKYPELAPLGQELTSLSGTLVELQKDNTKIGQIKFAALASYMGTIHAYFALFMDGIKVGSVDLKEHPVMEGIVKAREMWRQASELDKDEDQDESEEGSEDVDIEGEYGIEDDDEIEEEEPVSKKRRVELVNDESDSDDYQELPAKKSTKADDSSDEEDYNVPLLQKGKTAPAKKPGKRVKGDYEEGDPDAVDQAARDKHKRSIRFYTSKIDQQSRKSQRRNYGGDDDLEYRERAYERQKRLNEEARQRGQKTGNDRAENFDDSASEDEGNGRGGKDHDDDYYDKVVAAKQRRQQDKQQGHQEAVRAAKEGRLAELQESDQLGETGKRALNFQILKNKGLTPKRSKENRNARVKKRKRYEKAQKKLGSVRQQYKQPTSAYGGEKTGIKKNLSKSVKFNS